MICPHCSVNLLHKERTGRTCLACKRTFALEPKDNELRLHDVRMRTLAEKLGDGRGLRYTAPQLWYAASRNRIPPAGQASRGCFVTLVVITLVAAVSIVSANPFRKPVLLVGGPVLAVLVLCLFLARRRARRVDPVRMPMSLERFESAVLQRWAEVYGRRPRGLVPPTAAPLPAPPRPGVAVLCPDRAVLDCLAANDAPAAPTMAMVQSPDQVPPGVPAVVLHDASPSGLAFAAAARTALGERALVVGLLPRSVMAHENAVRLRESPLPQYGVAELRASCPTLTDEELDWLAQGWWSPLAAVPPAALLTAVHQAARRAAEATDPDHRGARGVGFLTWPER
ncbi:hypothetical protein AQ490_11275 [Wenjunlia vitaminophila]|uniref:Uncharacterized protein n=1 Tax=Wenjunlia vitaminophila TaxID=76728 RepID=A0A0T6LKB8_WENVI|nr:hypothetical protein [Wenjunlia vitaminophila]KRV46472.1 hypothetical protein AQ490_11275 [Wenjunlia vitaminophila]